MLFKFLAKPSSDFTLADSLAMLVGLTQFLLDGAAFAAAIIIIWSGIRITLSGGNEEQVNNAKNSLKWAIIGLIIIVFSKIIVGLTCQILGAGNQCFKF